MGRVCMALRHHLEGVGHPNGKCAAVNDGQGSGGNIGKTGGFKNNCRQQTGKGTYHELDESQPQGIGFG